MRHLLRLCLAMLALAAAGTASATFHTFRIDEIWSNGDGTLQYVVLVEASGLDSQHLWAGHTLSATGPGGLRNFVFPRNLPSFRTAGRSVLVGTQGFAALGLAAPDYVIPNGFLPTTDGAVDFAGVSQLSYAALPTSGDLALYADGTTRKNLATNFAGDSASVAVAATPAPNYQGLWWNPNESGWGINFAHQGDIVFATWFTYDAGGKPWWLVAELHRNADGTFSGPVTTVVGSPFDAVPFDTAGVRETTVGSMTASFGAAGEGSIAYTVNGIAQAKAITRQKFGTLPTCTFGALADLATAGNYTDLWWNPQESGWGVNFSHQDDVVFATWYTYDAAGKPWWLVAELHRAAAGVYTGDVSVLVGPAFDATPFDPGKVVESTAGKATVTFADGNAATFAYAVNGVARTKAITRQVFVAPGTACR